MKQRTKLAEQTAAALEGRLICLEAFAAVLLAHVADATDDPPAFIVDVMKNVGDQLERATAESPPERQRTMSFASEAFGTMSDGMIRHIGLYGKVVTTN